MSAILERITPLLEEKTSQAAILSGFLFFIVAHPWLFNQVDGLMKNVGINTGKGNVLLAIHAVVFAGLLYLLITVLFNPVMTMLDHHEAQTGQVMAELPEEQEE